MKKIFFLILMLIVGCGSPKLNTYIGLDIKSNEMQKFLNDLDNPEITKYKGRTISDSIADVLKYPELSPERTYSPYSLYSYKEKGILIKLNDKDLVDAIFLYGEGNEGYRQYKGKLPFNLKFTNNRKEILEKLGKPSHSFGGYANENYKCGDSFNLKGLTIEYNTTDSTNMLATISYICIEN